MFYLEIVELLNMPHYSILVKIWRL